MGKIKLPCETGGGNISIVGRDALTSEHRTFFSTEGVGGPSTNEATDVKTTGPPRRPALPVVVQFEAKMSDETRVKQIMLDAIIRHKEASTMSIRTAGAVVNAIYDALEKANVLAKIEKRHSPEKSG
jgi:hypothetical protein